MVAHICHPTGLQEDDDDVEVGRCLLRYNSPSRAAAAAAAATAFAMREGNLGREGWGGPVGQVSVVLQALRAGRRL